MDINIASNEEFTFDANEAIFYKLIRSQEDIEDEDIAFHPDMSHQIFGENEVIYGYKNPRVNVYYLAGSLSNYISLNYTKSVKSSTEKGDMKPDDVVTMLSEEMALPVHHNIDTFLRDLEKDATFKPFGVLKHTYKIDDAEANERQFEIYFINHKNPEITEFLDYHKKMQSFIKFFIDAASYIEHDDEKWQFYVLYERYQNVQTNNPSYAFVGYMTVYEFYAYPEHIRPRVSQMLVLPPFQRQGHGSQLLQTFYNDAIVHTRVVDITVEDPSENFQRMRDVLDSKNCMTLNEFSGDKVLRGYTVDMRRVAKNKLRLNARQTKRVYEILKLLHSKEHVQRLKYEEELRQKIEKMFMNPRSQVLDSNSDGSSSRDVYQMSTKEQQKAQIQEELKCILDEYTEVVEKLKI